MTRDDLIAEAQAYRLGPSDELEIRVDNLTQVGRADQFTPKVDQRGYISLPRTGPLYVLGKTEADATGITKTRAAKNERTTKTGRATRTERTVKTARHQKRNRFARHDRGRDPVVTATISKKRQKTKTAVSDTGWTLFQR